MTTPQSVAGDENLRCPNCGASEFEGGCENPRACAEAVVRMEKEFASEITNLLDQPFNNRPLHLLMAGFEALELLNIGVAVTSGSCQVLLLNRTAEQLLAARDGIELTPQGVLHTLRETQPSLSELIERSVHPGQPTNPHTAEVVLAVQRRSGRRALTLVVRSARHSVTQVDPTLPAALVFILDPELPVQAAEPELRQLYGFTATESRLANLLMEGKTIEDCCDELGVRRPTVCSHLQHLFRKTGAQRQSELVSLLFKSIGLVRAGSSERKPRASASPITFKNACARILRSRTSFS